MAGVARAWEQAAAGYSAGRWCCVPGWFWTVTPRRWTRLTGLTRWGLGGRVGSGRQWVSWLHVADLLAIVRRCIDDAAMVGVVHATSPYPVRNAELMAALRQVLRRRAVPATPAPLVRLGALLLRTDPALALTGRRCVPSRLLDAGFVFAYPRLVPALQTS
jgi:NAD dependent epimerase/dehydratase family enzyme